MKILHIGKFHPIRGGIEKVMLDLTEGLSGRGFECDMLCAASRGSYTITLNERARILAVRTLARVKSTMLAPAMILRLRRIRRHYDIVHIHHPDPMAALALRLSGFKGRVVLHWHSDILRQRKLLQLVRPLQAWLLRRADAIVGTSPAYLSESKWLTDVQHKCTCIPIGIASPESPSAADVIDIRERYGHRRIVFAMGRLVSYKGFEYLIDAAAMLPDSYVIVIGGTGPLESSLQERIDAAGLASKVILAGRIPDNRLSAYYRAATIFCLPSVERTEAFGVVQIEAMACGTPVVATTIEGSGVAWVNDHGTSGLNVPPRDPAALAKAIMAVAEHRDDYAEGALRRFEDNFTSEAMLDKTVDLYRSLIPGGE